MASVYSSPRHLGVERVLYRITGVDPDAEQRWTTYLRSVMSFSVVGVLFLYLLQRVQANAVKYSPPGVPVLVAGSTAGRRVELRVVDRGPGVPDEAMSAIFEPFQRLGDAPRGSGVGLGLAVARGFAEALRGSLTAEDTPGGGLTMVIALPAATSSTPSLTDVEPAQVAG
jgi:K+-sensing histidine kinase KdpD